MDIAVYEAGIPAMSSHAVSTVRRLETAMRKFEQAPYVIKHTLHAGMYARTVTLAPGLWAGAQVKRGTILTIIGDALVYVGKAEPLQVRGVTVMPASAGRKQAFVAQTEITLVMVAACDAATVAEAEAYLCAETDLLPSLDDVSKHQIEQTGE